MDIRDIDVGTYVKNARAAVHEQVDLPEGYSMVWSGQYEYMERARQRLQIVIPLTLVIIFLLLYLNFKNITESLIVMLSLPFSLVGGVWLLYLFNYNLSVAVGVGFIALAGVAAETGVIMLIYLDQAWKDRLSRGQMDLVEGSVRSHHCGSRRAGASQDDDRHGHYGRPVAHFMGTRYGLPGNEAHRGADGRGNGFVHDPDAGRHPGHLLPVEKPGIEKAGKSLRWELVRDIAKCLTAEPPTSMLRVQTSDKGGMNQTRRYT